MKCETIPKTKRRIDRIIIHCSATKPSMDIGVKEIRRWHTNKGWSDIGYHLVIRRDGTLELGRKMQRMGAHTKGFNYGSIGLCLVGGVNEKMKAEDNFTDNQWRTLRHTLRMLKMDYPLADIKGHNDFNPMKACPCFDVNEELLNGELKGILC